MLERFGLAPIGRGSGVKKRLAVLAADTLAVIVKPIDAPLFCIPCPVRFERAYRAEDVKVWVGDSVRLPVRRMDGGRISEQIAPPLWYSR